MKLESICTNIITGQFTAIVPKLVSYKERFLLCLSVYLLHTVVQVTIALHPDPKPEVEPEP